MNTFLVVSFLLLHLFNCENLGKKTITGCDIKTSKDFCRIKTPDFKKQPISALKTKVSLDIYPESLDIITFRRRVLYKKCYDGGSIDPNTGCTSKTLTVDAAPNEIRSYLLEDVCPVGYVCAPYGDCWGSWANDRCGNVALINRKKGDSTLKWQGETWMKFPYHTCIQSWECVIHKETVHITVSVDKGNTRVGFDLPTGGFVEIDDAFFVLGKIDESGFKHIASSPSMKIENKKTEMDCLGSREIGVVCRCLPKNGLPHANFLFPPRARSTSYRNYKVTILDPVIILTSSEKTYYAGEDETNDVPYEIINIDGMQNSPSVEDLIPILNSIHFIQLQSIFNIFQLEKEIIDLQRSLTRIISHLMRKDPWFLGEIVEEEIYTKNINEEIFKIMRCRRESLDMEGNCVGGFIYKDGALVQRKEKDMCEHYPEDAVKNITLFSRQDINAVLTSEGKIGPSSRDSPTWQWMVQFKEEQEEHGDFDQKDDGFVTNVESSLSELFNPFALFSKYFTFVSSCLTWILLLVLCLRKSK